MHSAMHIQSYIDKAPKKTLTKYYALAKMNFTLHNIVLSTMHHFLNLNIIIYF